MGRTVAKLYIHNMYILSLLNHRPVLAWHIYTNIIKRKFVRKFGCNSETIDAILKILSERLYFILVENFQEQSWRRKASKKILNRLVNKYDFHNFL